MYQRSRIIALVPAFNEERRIGRVVERTDSNLVDTILVIDDCSTDSTATVARSRGADVLTLDRRRGVGAALRSGFDYARRRNYDIAVILAGNDKDDPAQVSRLLEPILKDKKDFVIGSRFMEGGGCGGDVPLHRRFATRLHPWLLGKLAGAPISESTNGFRALRLGVLDDPRIDLNQRWLDAYGLEVYLLWKILTLGYRHAEVPCTKTYPPRATGYTKMVPVISWWSILRPILLLRLGLKH